MMTIITKSDLRVEEKFLLIFFFCRLQKPVSFSAIFIDLFIASFARAVTVLVFSQASNSTPDMKNYH